MRRLSLGILLVALFAPLIRADAAKILIVDPAETEAGELLAAQLKLSPDVAVTRVDITQLRRFPKVDANEVIWLNPEPTLYSANLAKRFNEIIADKKIGVLIVGLPNGDEGCEKLAEWLRPRDQFEIGPRINPHLHGANWIWSDQGTKDNQHVSLRKTFDCPNQFVHATLEVSGDNRVATYLNGQLLGTNEIWKSPAAYDVTSLLKRIGENELKFDAWNEDGPAGVVASLLITDGAGKQVLRLVTDKSWPKAKVIAPFGEGPWEDKIFANFAADEWPLTLDHESGVVRRNLIPHGKFDKVLATADLVTGITSGNTSVFSIELDKSALGPRLLQVLCSTAFEHLHRPYTQVKELPHQATQAAAKPLDRETFFPITIQFSPIPHEGVADSARLPDTLTEQKRLIDNLIEHGCTLLQCPLPLPEKEAREVEDYAQSRGMGITYVFEHGLEGFSRDKPPAHPLESEAYKQELLNRLDQRLKVLDHYTNLVEVFPMQDEPFHVGAVGAGSPPPPDFRIAWRLIYEEIKRRYPKVNIVLNHDSHNTFGGAAGQEGKIFIDDVYTWGNDFADTLAFDIYPYLMTDFRYGPNRKLMLPRMAQMHFAIAQMRTVTQPPKAMGFYVGTYNPEWFDLTAKGREQYWMSREMAYTAVAGGANDLIGGVNVPIDARHWEDLGEAFNTLQKASPALRHTTRPRASAAMYFPREQCLKTQEEYWNVAQSFEMLQRAHGELDVMHEDAAPLELSARGGRKLLALFDVRVMPPGAMEAIERWVGEQHGVLVADCVPRSGERSGDKTLNALFGVSASDSRRILWPVKMKPEVESDPERPATMPAATQPTDIVRGRACGIDFDFPIVSPRPCVVTDGEVVLKTASGKPAIVRRKKWGKGAAYLLGFCLQDTAFEAWRRNDRRTIDQLTELLRALASDDGVKADICSSNGDIEAALRTSASDTFIVAVAHEPADPQGGAGGATHVTLRHLKPPPRGIEDVASGEEVPFEKLIGEDDAIQFDLSMPTGSTRLLHILH